MIIMDEQENMLISTTIILIDTHRALINISTLLKTNIIIMFTN